MLDRNSFNLNPFKFLAGDTCRKRLPGKVAYESEIWRNVLSGWDECVCVCVCVCVSGKETCSLGGIYCSNVETSGTAGYSTANWRTFRFSWTVWGRDHGDGDFAGGRDKHTAWLFELSFWPDGDMLKIKRISFLFISLYSSSVNVTCAYGMWDAWGQRGATMLCRHFIGPPHNRTSVVAR